MGQPNDAEFQKRVLRACLGLLHAESGSVLEDYPEELLADAVRDDMILMSCPIDLPPLLSNYRELSQSLVAEIGHIAPCYELAVNQRSRTTVEIINLNPDRMTSQVWVIAANQLVMDLRWDQPSLWLCPELVANPFEKSGPSLIPSQE